MKKFKSIILTVALSLVFFACEQEVTELKPNPYSPSSPTGQSGSADFSKFVSIGGAYVAGFGDGGLLHSGLQPYSVGRMVAVQLAKAGGHQLSYNQISIQQMVTLDLVLTVFLEQQMIKEDGISL